MIPALLLLAGGARAERPLTCAEAVAAAARGSGAAVRGGYALERAEAAALAARGWFDPVHTVTGTWGHLAFDDVRDALPLSGDDWTWDLATTLSWTTPTGTTFSLGGGVGFDRSFAAGLQPRYDENGDQIGTAPFEAMVSAYRSGGSATVSQQLLRGVLASYNLQAVRQARQAWTTADLAAEQARQQAMADAALACWTWVYHDQVRAIEARAVADAEEALRVAEAQVAARRLAPIERSRLEAALMLARSRALDAEVLARQARDELLVAMGEPPGQAVSPASAPDDDAIVVDAQGAVEAALAHNLELAVARSTLASQRLTHAAARHARLPSLELVASAGRSTGNQPTLADAVRGLSGARAQPAVSVGGVFTVPLGNRAAIGAARAAEVDVRAAESGVEELERRIGAQVAHQVALLDAAVERVELADAAVRLGEETLEATEALTRVGRALPKDVLEARTELDRARVAAVRARVDRRLAHTELLRLQAALTEAPP